MEKKGIPTVTIVTTPYKGGAETAAKDQGVTAMPLLIVEHPIAGHDAAGIKAKAETIFPELLKAATAQ